MQKNEVVGMGIKWDIREGIGWGWGGAWGAEEGQNFKLGIWSSSGWRQRPDTRTRGSVVHRKRDGYSRWASYKQPSEGAVAEGTGRQVSALLSLRLLFPSHIQRCVCSRPSHCGWKSVLLSASLSFWSLYEPQIDAAHILPQRFILCLLSVTKLNSKLLLNLSEVPRDGRQPCITGIWR